MYLHPKAPHTVGLTEYKYIQIEQIMHSKMKYKYR